MDKKVPEITPHHAEVGERSLGRVARNRMRIAWMYYVEGLTQSEIAERLGIGRITVVRNLSEALKHREVKILITGDVAECLELETELKAAYGLLDAVVVPEPAQAENVPKVIGAAAGIYVADLIRDGTRVGVGWGRTLYESLQTFAPRELKGVEVVSLLGGIVEAKRFNPSEFAWQFAATLGADCYLLAAPVVVDSPETKQALISRCGLDKVIERAQGLDIALLSVGRMAADATSFSFSFLNDEDRLSLIAKGAVGDVLFNYFDREGKLVDHPINQRSMSVPIEAIRQAGRRLLVAGGEGKADAIAGAVKFAQCNVLVTNEAMARELIARKKPA